MKAKKKKSDKFTDIVDALCAASSDAGERMRRGPNSSGRPLPSRNTVIRIVDDLRTVFFPGYFGSSQLRSGDESLRYYIGSTLNRIRAELDPQIMRGLCFACVKPAGACAPGHCGREAEKKTAAFVARLSEIRRLLATDVQAHYEGDPAATSTDEAIICYPGMLAITSYRIAHELHKLRVPLIPRVITEHAHSLTGIDIHPGARIGERFFIDHGTGVVIGETCVIGDGVRLYQGVTLGAKSFPKDKKGNPIKGIARHPIVEDDVVIYSGATILGRVTIGKGSVIGGNVWLTKDVPPGSRVAQKD
ncbi:MAG: serine O-acetyltransferase EpsC [Elusimicrobiota bacterium]